MTGTDGNDRIKGTHGPDAISALAGNDVVRAFRGADMVSGAEGFDRLFGGKANDVLDGGPGFDIVGGGKGDDVARGAAGFDRVFGGPGDDRLWAMARRDHLAADGTGDTLVGGPGNDKFRTREGQPDKIDCGEGFDIALADFKDIIVDASAANPKGSCERVIRKRRHSRKDRNDQRKAEHDDDRYEKEGEKGKD